VLRRGSLPPAPLGLPLQLSYRVLMCHPGLQLSAMPCCAGVESSVPVQDGYLDNASRMMLLTALPSLTSKSTSCIACSRLIPT
jgi:hypothetical protein